MEQQQLPFDKRAKLVEIEEQIVKGKELLEQHKQEVEAYLAQANEDHGTLTRNLLRLEGARVILREMGAANEDA